MSHENGQKFPFWSGLAGCLSFQVSNSLNRDYQSILNPYKQNYKACEKDSSYQIKSILKMDLLESILAV